MKSSLIRFLSISITNLVVGLGSGTIAGFCLTARNANLDERLFYSVFIIGSVGALHGLLLGWIAYYFVFRQNISFETYTAIVAISCVLTSILTYLLQLINTELGYLALYLFIPMFLMICLKIKKHSHTK